MSLNRDLETLNAIERLLQPLRDRLPELDRRARIPSNRDGYPRRASGAYPGTSTPARNYTVSTQLEAGGWRWRCACGIAGTAIHPSSHAALEHGHIHWENSHPQDDTTTAIDYADPTGEMVAGNNGHRPDPVTQRRRRLTRELDRMYRAAQAALAQLADPANTETDSGQWCQSCARIKHDDGRPWLSPLRPGLTGATDVGGRLKKPMYLCRFCYDHVAREGSIPSPSYLAEYLTRGRAPRKSA